MQNLNNDVAQFLLMLSKVNEYSNNEIKSVHFTDVIDVNIYNNSNNHNDNTQIYCVYADYIDKDSKDNNDISTAEFYFCVEYSKYYNVAYSNTQVYYLYAINQH